MFLALENLTGAGTSPGMEERELDRLAEHYLKGLRYEPEFFAAALEVLAAHHFGLVRHHLRKGQRAIGRALLRTINFHNTPRSRRAEYERQLLEAGEQFSSASEDDIRTLLSGDPPPGPKPGILPVFYEGYRNNYEVALPLLERAGLRGWFFVPTAFIDTPVPQQYAFAWTHHIGLTDGDAPGVRCAMTWDELRDVADRGHVIACHTATHCGISDITGPEDEQRELFHSRSKLEEELGREVRTLAWLHGTPYAENQRIDDAVREAGYRLVFSNAKIQNIPHA